MTQLELFKENFNMYKDIDKIDVSEILDLNNEKKFPELEKDHFILYKTGKDDFILKQMGKVFPGLYNNRTGSFLKPRLRGCGSDYRMWMIRGTYSNKDFMYDIECHRMVALAFINNPDPIKKNIVNHIDKNKCNYRMDNLEWVTRRENSLGHNVDKGIVKRRELELIEKFNTKELDLSKVQLYQDKARKELEALKKTFWN